MTMEWFPCLRSVDQKTLQPSEAENNLEYCYGMEYV